jgi:hypothetical protein
MGKGKALTKQDVSRIMGSQAQKTGGKTPKDSWVGRVQSAEAKNDKNGKQPSKGR